MLNVYDNLPAGLLEDRVEADALLLRKPFSMDDLVRIVDGMLQPGEAS